MKGLGSENYTADIEAFKLLFYVGKEIENNLKKSNKMSAVLLCRYTVMGLLLVCVWAKMSNKLDSGLLFYIFLKASICEAF